MKNSKLSVISFAVAVLFTNNSLAATPEDVIGVTETGTNALHIAMNTKTVTEKVALIHSRDKEQFADSLPTVFDQNVIDSLQDDLKAELNNIIDLLAL